MKKVNNKKGFTLAELLVVVAILAILIAIAVPIFGSAMDNATKTAKEANARSIKSAAMVKIMQDNTAKGTNGWKVEAYVDTDGSIHINSISAQDSAAPGDSLPSGGINGDTNVYTVYLKDTDLS